MVNIHFYLRLLLLDFFGSKQLTKKLYSLCANIRKTSTILYFGEKKDLLIDRLIAFSFISGGGCDHG